MSSGLGVWCLPRGWRTTHSNRSIWPQPIPIWFQLQNLISHWICNTQSRMQTILVFAIVNACNKAYRRSRRRLWWKCLSTDTHTNTHSLQSRLALLCTEKSNSTTYLFIGEKKKPLYDAHIYILFGGRSFHYIIMFFCWCLMANCLLFIYLLCASNVKRCANICSPWNFHISDGATIKRNTAFGKAGWQCLPWSDWVKEATANGFGENQLSRTNG